jgi:DNA-binding transcriptional ArsR family regulator
MVKSKTQTLELMKILSDPRRSKILHLASEKPVTVKYLAEVLEEEPLRLYYHVKKLLKADLLEVAETRQLGNLTEKYYQTINFTDTIYQGDYEEQAEHLELTLSLVHQKLDPGLLLYKKALEKIREENDAEKKAEKLPYQVMINSGTDRMTGKEWRKLNEKVSKVLGKSEEDEEWPQVPLDTRDDEEGTYQYVLISYKIEDAEKLGIIQSDDGKKG